MGTDGQTDLLELLSEEADVADLKNVDDLVDLEPTRADTFSISSYGADYTVDSLVKRVSGGDFFVPPFQRAFVWNIKQSSRFVESLLMGLPVPSIFVFREADTNKHLIIDGQQRLRTLEYFYRERFREDKIFKLDEVRAPWNGKTCSELDEADRRRLDDSIIHTTIFRQESPKNDDSVYEVFERINTGGVKLSAQEIRNCVNFGQFTSLLGELNENEAWRKIYGPRSPRMKDQELILRFFAFFDGVEKYKRPLRSFLNRYMESRRKLTVQEMTALTKRFSQMIEAVHLSLGEKAFRPERALNTAVFDAVSVGLGRRLAADPFYDPAKLRTAYDTLLADPKFRATYTRATADEENVKDRFALADKAFTSI